MKHEEKNIGVFFGSGSVEHDISIITANLIISGLKGLNYQVTPIYITKQGKWMLGEDLGNLKLFSDPNKKVEEAENYAEYYLDMQESIGKMVFKKKGLLGKSTTIDLAFPALHGTFGEDGTIQGLFEMFGIPYIGCGVPASAISMDKALTKIMMRDAGIPTTKFIYFYRNNWETSKTQIIEQVKKELKWPVMVKPSHLGSSIGIGKGKDEKELEQKVEVAVYYDNKVVVEEVVEDLMDVTCCVIGNFKPRASELQESLYTIDLFSFEDKYIREGGSQTGKNQRSVVIPARLNEAETQAIKATAIKVYKLLECTGIARVDFLVNRKTNKFFANEVNPLPGTLYHHLWQASGVEFPELLQTLIKYAQENYEQKRQISRYFESSVLRQLGSSGFRSNKLQ
ncbi:MAG: D-alanine--D-alanine ligase [Candidatus Doudnabacteria bacterium]|nr:D-alanine--D-alanine ligase [Candidatus Doudnabacteria bacterium]